MAGEGEEGKALQQLDEEVVQMAVHMRLPHYSTVMAGQCICLCVCVHRSHCAVLCEAAEARGYALQHRKQACNHEPER